MIFFDEQEGFWVQMMVKDHQYFNTQYLILLLAPHSLETQSSDKKLTKLREFYLSKFKYKVCISEFDKASPDEAF